MDIRNQIKLALEKLNWTVPEAAKAWKVNRRTLENWVQGRSTPRGLALVTLQAILDPILAAKPASPSTGSPAQDAPAGQTPAARKAKSQRAKSPPKSKRRRARGRKPRA